jgi:peptide/nickel transport system substrate-binding protein
MTRLVRLVAAGLLGLSVVLPHPAFAQNAMLRISTTERLITTNPYGDSNGQMYSIWCQVYGCLGVYDWQQKKYVGMLAESWEVVGPTTWRFHLRKDLTRHDGGPAPTAKDVVHAYRRVMADLESTQKSMVADVADVTVVDEHTVDFHTKAPDAILLSFLFDRFAVSSEELFTKLGREADNKTPYGWGPYKLDEFVLDQRVVLSRNDHYPGIDPKTPQRVIYQTIMEPEQRVTALLNGEVEIARLIPPHLVNRMENRSDVSVARTDSIEHMFLGLNNAFKPWDDVRVRRAASHAIDRDLIIQKLFNGDATRLDGPVGSKPSVCYAGGVKGAYAYDPVLAKNLLTEAGYKDGGPEIELLTSNNRHIADKLVAEVITQMLTRVGFKVKLQVLEYAKLWSLVRPGKAPTYYFNRGSVFEPADSMAQYFETGGSPRIGYSNPKFDELIARVRQEFEETTRCALLNQAAAIVVEDAPMIHLWTHALVSGVRKGITYPANASGEVWLANIRM